MSGFPSGAQAKEPFGWSRIGTFPKQAGAAYIPAASRCGPNPHPRLLPGLPELVSAQGEEAVPSGQSGSGEQVGGTREAGSHPL